MNNALRAALLKLRPDLLRYGLTDDVIISSNTLWQ